MFMLKQYSPICVNRVRVAYNSSTTLYCVTRSRIINTFVSKVDILFIRLIEK